MAYTPPPRRSSASYSRQGLLDLARGGNALLSQYLPPSGVRTNFIAGPPDPAAMKGATSYLSNISAPGSGLPTPTSPAVTQTYTPPAGQKTSDVLKQLTTPIPFRDPSTLGIPTQGVQGSTNILQSATDLANAQAQRPTGEEGPESVVAPAQSFFSRMVGEKGSGQRSDIGRSMMQAGAAMMKGSPDGTFATIGQGLEAGLGGYQDLKEDRRTEEDWTNKQADRERTLAAVETLKEGRTEQQQATIDAAIASGDYGKAGELAESYATDERLDEVFDESGGHYITDEYEYDFVKNMDPVARNEYMLDFITSDRARVGRATAIQQLYPGMSDEDAENLSHDAPATDRMMSRPTETQIFTGADGVGYLIDTSMNAEGDRTLDTFGPVKIDLDAARFAAQQEAAEREGVEDVFADLREEYKRFVPAFNGIRDYERALELLDGQGPEPHTGAMSNIQKNVGKWFKGDRAQSTQEIDNVLLGLGMQNLAYFRGAISEKEMEQALKKAGTTGDLKGALRQVLENAVAKQATEMETHNARVEQYIGGPDSPIDDWDYWQLDPVRLRQMQGEATTDELDFEDEEPPIVEDEQVVYDAGSTAPVDTSGGLMGRVQRAAAIRRAEEAQEEQDRLAYEEWKKSQAGGGG